MDTLEKPKQTSHWIWSSCWPDAQPVAKLKVVLVVPSTTKMFSSKFFSSVSILQVDMSFYVDRIVDLILAKTSALYLVVCSAFDALC